MNSRNVVISQFGRAESVVSLASQPVERPQAGEILLRTRFAPINPADINVMEGTYGKLPPLPAAVGNESVGVVEAVGPGVEDFALGEVVLPLSGLGLWSEFVRVSATEVIKLPKEIDLAQASMLRVNPATAWLLLTEFESLKPGDWVVQNAANSAVGLAVIQLAQANGWRVLNLVRREEAAAVCRAAGADHVVAEDAPDFKDQVSAIMGTEKARLGLNAVGGESALRVAGMLGDRAHHVTFGAMSRQKLSIPNRFLIFQEMTFTGFWLNKWMQRNPREKQQEIYRSLAEKMTAGKLKLAVDTIYPVEEIVAAVTHAQQGKRNGKILLQW